MKFIVYYDQKTYHRKRKDLLTSTFFFIYTSGSVIYYDNVVKRITNIIIFLSFLNFICLFFNIANKKRQVETRAKYYAKFTRIFIPCKLCELKSVWEICMCMYTCLRIIQLYICICLCNIQDSRNQMYNVKDCICLMKFSENILQSSNIRTNIMAIQYGNIECRQIR